jgi:hypothetical protein
LCHAARTIQPSNLWDSLADESHHETLICEIFEAVCVLLIILAFLWAFLP